MTEVLIYRPTKVSAQKVLPKLLESVIAKGNNVHILCETDDQVAQLDDFLWTYEQLSFLPHATYKDEQVEKQPIILSVENKNLNNASVLVMMSQKLPENFSDFSKLIYIADSNQGDLFEKAKAECANNNLKFDCFVQNEKGWEKKEGAAI